MTEEPFNPVVEIDQVPIIRTQAAVGNTLTWFNDVYRVTNKTIPRWTPMFKPQQLSSEKHVVRLSTNKNSIVAVSMLRPDDSSARNFKQNKWIEIFEKHGFVRQKYWTMQLEKLPNGDDRNINKAPKKKNVLIRHPTMKEFQTRFRTNSKKIPNDEEQKKNAVSKKKNEVIVIEMWSRKMTANTSYEIEIPEITWPFAVLMMKGYTTKN